MWTNGNGNNVARAEVTRADENGNLSVLVDGRMRYADDDSTWVQVRCST